MTDAGLSASENMSSRLTAAQFSAFPGVTDWRVLWGGGYAAARFLTGSFAAGAALVAAIGELAAASGHDPDVDVRPQSVTVRLCTAEVHGLTSRDAGLAREISAAAARLQAPPDPASVQHVQVAIDALDIARVRPFWHAVLGYAAAGEEDLLRRAPLWWTLADPEGNEADLAIWG